MNSLIDVLVLGSGAREAAIVWLLEKSPGIRNIYVAPGNGWMKRLGAINIYIKATDIKNLIDFVKRHQISLTIVGPEEPLAMGIVDAFRNEGLRIFGPTLAASKIEASKVLAKEFMKKYYIPTAPFEVFDNYEKALRHVGDRSYPLVIKADGLALGKGVRPCKNLEEAKIALQEIMVQKIHGQAGNMVLVEDFLTGPEISCHVLCGGEAWKTLIFTQDYKPIFDNDKGKNTGGMGAYGPLPWLTEEIIKKIQSTIIDRTLYGMIEKNIFFTGCLYPGLILTPDGPKVIEYNVRFGDPEWQVIARLLKSEFLGIINDCVDGNLHKTEIEWEPGHAVCVVATSGGYPGDYEKGKKISGIEEAEKIDGLQIFGAGVADLDSGDLITSSGRVLSVTGNGLTLEEARIKTYSGIDKISFEGMYDRKDIAKQNPKRWL
ncbi:MAG: phosphoribosylamine--glycine ligase [bacterium]